MVVTISDLLVGQVPKMTQIIGIPCCSTYDDTDSAQALVLNYTLHAEVLCYIMFDVQIPLSFSRYYNLVLTIR